MYTVVNQIYSVLCTTPPAGATEVGAFIYVSFPQNLRIKRITIYAQADSEGVIPTTAGGISFTRQTDSRNYIYVDAIPGVGYEIPFVLSVTNPADNITGGIYLATFGKAAGDGTIFSLIYEGEQ